MLGTICSFSSRVASRATFLKKVFKNEIYRNEALRRAKRGPSCLGTKDEEESEGNFGVAVFLILHLAP
jgi:hypothetical protein